MTCSILANTLQDLTRDKIRWVQVQWLLRNGLECENFVEKFTKSLIHKNEDKVR